MFTIYNFALLFLLFGGFYTFLQTRVASFAIRVSLGIFLTLAFLSSFYHLFFLLNIPYYCFGVEIALLLCVFGYCGKQYSSFPLWEKGKALFGSHPILLTGWLLCLGYLLFQVVVLPPTSYDSMKYHLPRVWLFAQEHSIFLLKGANPLLNAGPTGHDILHFMMLRFGSDYGVGIFAFWEYLGIGFGLYALCGTFASRVSAFTACLAGLAFPLTVLQATSTKNDLMVVFSAVIALLALLELTRHPRIETVFVLILALVMGVAVKQYYAAFALTSFVCFAGYWIWIGHHKSLLPLIRPYYLYLALFALSIVMVSGWWTFFHNAWVWGHWAGPPYYVNAFLNDDGLKGAFANGIRYVLQSFHLLFITDFLYGFITHASLRDLFQDGYDRWVFPWLGNAGAFTPFRLVWLPKELEAWFGPLAPLLIYPSLVYGLIKGSPLLRMVILSIGLYALLICYQLAWMSFNGRFLSPFFMLGCIPLAYALDALPKFNALRTTILFCSMGIMAYTAMFNINKPLITKDGLRQLKKQGWEGIWEESVYAKSGWGSDRLFYSVSYYKDRRVYEFREKVEKNAVVGILAKELDTWIYHYLYARPDVYFVPLSHDTMQNGVVKKEAVAGLDYLVTIKTKCRKIERLGYRVLWRSGPHAMPGSLIGIENNDRTQAEFPVSHWHIW